MREFRSYGSVGEALGNRCLYPERYSKLDKMFFERNNGQVNMNFVKPYQ